MREWPEGYMYYREHDFVVKVPRNNYVAAPVGFAAPGSEVVEHSLVYAWTMDDDEVTPSIIFITEQQIAKIDKTTSVTFPTSTAVIVKDEVLITHGGNKHVIRMRDQVTERFINAYNIYITNNILLEIGGIV